MKKPSKVRGLIHAVFKIILILRTWSCSGLVEKGKESAWSLAEQAVLEMFLGLYFLLKRVNACRIKFMKKND